MIIAVDGPAASGKGTIARAIATYFSLPHLDTGLLYRAVGVATARARGNPDCEADALAACNFGDTFKISPAMLIDDFNVIFWFERELRFLSPFSDFDIAGFNKFVPNGF